MLAQGVEEQLALEGAGGFRPGAAVQFRRFQFGEMGWRQGDGAPLSLVELVTFAPAEEKKKSRVEKVKEVLGRVAPKKKEKKEKGEEKVKEKKEKKEKKEEKEALKEKKEKEKKEKPKKISSKEKTK